MDAQTVVENLGLFRFQPESLDVIKSEVERGSDRSDEREVRRDLLLLSAAEIELVYRFCVRGETPELPLTQPLAVSRDAAAVAAQEVDCGAFGCDPLAMSAPWHVAVFSGDVAKLELARAAVRLRAWSEATAADVMRIVEWIRDEWNDRESERAGRAAVARLQGLLWAGKIERVLRPETLEASLLAVARKLDVTAQEVQEAQLADDVSVWNTAW